MTPSPITTLGEIVGQEVSAVSFVRTYVELHFDGPLLRIFSDPIVVDSMGRWSVAIPGFRDALCRLIGAIPTAVEFDGESALRVEFGSGTRLTIPLGETPERAESLHFLAWPSGYLEVWQ